VHRLLLLDVDPVGLVRQRKQAPESFALADYVSDRPYVASSFLSVALGRVFGTALSGRCDKRPELVEALLDFTVRIAPLPSRGGEVFLRSLFEPLGYAGTAERHALDGRFPEWGDSRFFTVTLQARCRLRDLLATLEPAALRVPELSVLRDRYRQRAIDVAQYIKASGRYCWRVESISDLRLAPFHLLASEGRVHADRDHVWHMDTLARLAA
jgi:hypothetical protein